MARKFLPSLAAAAFATILFRLFSRRGDQARSTEESASGNDGTAGGASSTHTSAEGQEVATSSGYDGTAEGQYQARSMEESASGNDGTAGGASSTHTSTEGQEVDNSSGYDYEVFLSFRGPDTRAAFTDFLYTSLKDAGIRTFRDDEELHVGEKFAQELPQAIKQSKISIPIFSKGYASSPWCLKELVQMVECQKNGSQKIMPIFYDVAPSEVRYQTRGYKEAFRSHENKKRYDEKTMQDWKDALSTVGAIHGWDLHNQTNRREGEFAKEVTKEVFRELKKAHLEVSDCLVGVDNQVDEIMEMIGAQTSEIRIIGIHGMGGIGKTTIAKIIYNRLSSNFEDCCFLSDIRETSKGKGVECLQKQLISNILKMKETDIDINNVDEGTRKIKERFSNKKVLLLLDDVETENHIDAFVGKRDRLGKRDWFGRGSRIIVTTRNKDILHFPGVYCSYELKCMDPVQSLKLFSKHAFRRDSPLDEDMNQSKRAVDIARGLPLALEVIGSLLSLNEKKKWDDILKDLETVPPGQVLGKLEISFNALGKREQRIFIDMACLFIGYEKDVVIYFWDDILCPKKSMGVLESMSLMKIDDDNKVWMHDLVRDLGREIIRRESDYKIQEQSRVWDPEEALRLLGSQKMKKKLEALRLRLDHQCPFAYEDFKRLPNLSFLEVCGSKGTFHAEERLLWHASPSNVFPTNEDSHLLPKLRWLSWHDIPPTFNITIFSAANVVILNLSQSKITDDWKGWSHVKMMENLKVMDLNNCDCLKRTPDFPAPPKLERLILQGCYRLVEIDKSICQLESLVFLDVSHCRNLRRLPNTIGNLKSLIELDICETGIEELPVSIESFELLITLNISSTRIKELPDSIGKLNNLKVVKINRSAISKIPNALWTIEKLEVIEAIMTSCKFDVEIGNHICRNRSLRILVLFNGIIYTVPRLPESLTILKLSDLYMNTLPDLSNLTNLEELDLRFVQCDYDGGSDGGSDGESHGPVEEDTMSLRIGSLHGESDGLVKKDLPQWIGNLSKLKSVRLWCPNLRCLPSLPSSLLELDLRSERVTALPTDMSSLLPRLEKLRLECPNLHCLSSLPSSLSKLYLESKCVAALPTDMSSLLPRLEDLSLRCPNLSRLRSLPSSLCSLSLYGCMSGGSMEGEDLSNLKTLSCLYMNGCAISEIRVLDRLENIHHLALWNIGQVKILPDLSNLNKLKSLDVCGFDNLVEIQGEFPSSLLRLRIFDCGSLQKLPDLSRLKGLRVEIEDCLKLNVKEISSLCSEKGIEFEGDDS